MLKQAFFAKNSLAKDVKTKNPAILQYCLYQLINFISRKIN